MGGIGDANRGARPGRGEAAGPRLLEVPLRSIREDPDTQSRQAISDEVVAEYAEVGDLPPIEVYGGPGEYWIGDGWHRYLAAVRAGRKAIRARVYPGGRDEAIEHACRSNRSHGLRRTRADVRRSIELMLTRLAHKNYTDRYIANEVGCSPTTVGSVRAELGSIVQIGQSRDAKRTEVRNGKEIQRSISANQRPRADPAEDDQGRGRIASAGLAPGPSRGDPPDAIPGPAPPDPEAGDGADRVRDDPPPGPAPRARDWEWPEITAPPEGDFPDGCLPIPVEILQEAEEERRREAIRARQGNDQAPPTLAESRWQRAITEGPDHQEQDPMNDPEPSHDPRPLSQRLGLDPEDDCVALADDDAVAAEVYGPPGPDEPDPAAWIGELPLWHELPPRTRPILEHDCRLYEAIKPFFRAFRASTRPVLDEARRAATRGGHYIPLDGNLGLFDVTCRFLATRHPRHWRICRECEGHGQGGLGQPCGSCRSKGYRVG